MEAFDEHFEAELRAALRVAPTEDLADRIEMEMTLKHALHVERPAGLNDRVYATAPHPAASPIDRTRVRWRLTAALAAAAAIALAWTLFTFDEARHHEGMAMSFDVAALQAQIDQVTADAELAAATVMPVDGELAALAFEIDQFAWALDASEPGMDLDSQIDELEEELHFLEAQFDVF